MVFTQGDVMKKLKYSGSMIIIAFMCIAIGPGQAFSADSYTSADAKAMKSDDPDAVADVLYKLADIHKEQGKEGLKAAVPDLIEAVKKELSLPEDERWNLIDVVKVLSMTGDERTKPMLLHIMSVMWGGGNPFVAQGFLSIGSSTVQDVADSLKSASPETRGRAALTLYKMEQFDESGEFFSKKERGMIRDRLAANFDDEDVNVRINTVVAMRNFGDNSVIAALEQIKKYDAHKDSGGTYEVRIEAAETLKRLKGGK